MIKLLSEVAEVTGGHTFRTKAEAASGHVRLLQIKDIQEGILTDFFSASFCGYSARETENKSSN